MTPEVQQFTTLKEASEAAAQFIVNRGRKSIVDKGRFSLLLGGGNTPRYLYRLLGSPPFADPLASPYTHFFWGDERCVPFDNSASNFAMAQETLFALAQPPAANIHRIETEKFTPDEAAGHYEKNILSFFNIEDKASTPPLFDLTLQGMGNDGHTASLFPGDPALNELNRLVVAVQNDQASPPLPRITVTLPLLNNAHTAIFLIAGPQKGKIMQEIIDYPDKADDLYPAARVRPTNRLVWFYAAHE